MMFGDALPRSGAAGVASAWSLGRKTDALVGVLAGGCMQELFIQTCYKIFGFISCMD